MPLLPPDSRYAQLEQKAVLHPMNGVKIAQWEHPAHPVPQHAKPATKESLTTTTVVVAVIVWKKHFKIKVPVHRAESVRQDGNSPTKDHPPASVSIGKPRQVAKTRNI